MLTFVTLPSGTVVNLALITWVERNEQHGTATLTVHFPGTETMVLSSEDAVALSRSFPSGRVWSSNVRTAVFWCVIAAALLLLWLVISTSRSGHI